MVLKKTNCHGVNSGNTMRKRYFTPIHQKYQAQTTQVIKYLHNIQLVKPNPNDGKTWEVDAAKSYFDDGGLAHTGPHRSWFMRMVFPVCYSMNKKKRWQLEDVIAEAVHDEELTKEPFKVTLVRRAIPFYELSQLGYLYSNSNATHYYDSHMPARMATSNHAFSLRQSLLQKGSNKQKEELDKRSKRRLKRCQGHNQHFRGVQRKVLKRSSAEDKIRGAAVVEHDNISEIRYEIAEAQQLTSSSFRYRGYHDRYFRETAHRTHFRGPHRERVSWYYTDSTHTAKKGCSNTVSDHNAVAWFKEDEEGESVCDDLHSPPAQQEFSLLDLAMATRHKQHQKPMKNSRKAAKGTETVLVNSASNQRVKKYAKGSAIFIEKEEGDVRKDADDDLDFMQKMAAEADTDGDSGLHSDAESDSVSFKLSSAAVTDYEEELSRFDDSFCSCGIPQHEFNIYYLQDTFGSAVEVGKCSPFTVRFNIQAVSLVLNLDMMQQLDADLAEWWLICQIGERLPCWLDDTRHTEEDGVMVNMKLHGSHEESDVEAVNLELQQLVNSVEQADAFSMHTLLVLTCDLVGRHLSVCSSSRRSSSESNSASGPQGIYLPHELFVGQVTVCSVKKAYHYLQSAEQLSLQETAEEADLGTFCSLTWAGECSICFSGLDKDAANEGRFSNFVAMSACGHCFCRQCWQHHLVFSILEGQTTLNCMEYKCEMTVDTTTLLSLVPQWVFARWEQRLHSKAVECSGEWRWCPNARCGLLAKSEGSGKDDKLGEGTGVPVVCQCQKRWCLDCGRDAHWPVTCAQFNTYTKMLKQNGDEDGLKTTAIEVTYVKVKRCPGCHYPLEKNGGCSHMACSQCGKSFCWVCLKDWSEHVSGQWFGCNERPEEMVELDNDKVYPLPIECYKKAVTYRYTWKNLDRVRCRTVIDYHNLCTFMRRSEENGGGDALPGDAVSRVTDALFFLRKAYMLLELSYILLSNCPRHHELARHLRTDLDVLEFTCRRVAHHLDQPKKRVLKMTDALQRATHFGHRHIHQACRHSHCLMSRVQGTAAQDWLLQADPERFVRYK